MYKKFKKILAAKPPLRAPEAQRRVDEQTASLVFYHFPFCPYCYMVQREIKRLSLTIQQRDIRQSRVWHKELLRGGGKDQVPCLRIQQPHNDRWLYESDDIIRYLKKHFAP